MKQRQDEKVRRPSPQGELFTVSLCITIRSSWLCKQEVDVIKTRVLVIQKNAGSNESAAVRVLEENVRPVIRIWTERSLA